MIELIDSYYSEILSKESMRGLRQAAKDGFHTGGRPPYGYRLKNVVVGNTVKKVWEIEPQEAEAVRLIYKLHSQGRKYVEIIEELENRKYKPRQSTEWRKSSVSEILRKPCYSGTHYFNVRRRKELGKRVHLRDEKDRSEWIPVKVPQIVDEETFNAVKARMKKRRFETTRRRTAQILTGLLTCGKCGEPYFIGHYYRGKYPYYRCSTKMKKGVAVCDNRNLRGDELDKVIMEEATGIILSRKNLEKYRELIDDAVKDERKEIKETLDRLLKEEKELAKKKAVYYEGLETGKLDMDLVADRLKELKEEEERISKVRLQSETRLLELPKAEDYALNKKEYKNLKESLKEFIEEAEPQQKRVFLSKFIDRITVYPEKITIEYFPPAFPNRKSPNQRGQSFSVIGMASPAGFEPTLPA